jgi:hypothetical protein
MKPIPNREAAAPMSIAGEMDLQSVLTPDTPDPNARQAEALTVHQWQSQIRLGSPSVHMMKRSGWI